MDECEFTRVPGHLHAPIENGDRRRSPEIKGKMRSWPASSASMPRFSKRFRTSRPGVRFANQAKFHPRKYLAKLIETIPAKAPMSLKKRRRMNSMPKSAALRRTGTGLLRPRRDYNEQSAGRTRQRDIRRLCFKPSSRFTAVTFWARAFRAALCRSRFSGTRKTRMYYLRVDRHEDFDYVIFGGEDHKTGQVLKARTIVSIASS